MSNMRAAMAAELDALKNTQREGGTGGGNKKYGPRVTMVYEPQVECKYVKDGAFSWDLKKPNGTVIPYSYPKIKGVIVGQGFTWGTLSQDETTNKWSRGCSVSSHVTGVGPEDETKVIQIRGDGHWSIPYWDHAEVVKKYDPVGTKIDPETQEAMKCGTCIFKSKDPESGVVRTCKDMSGIFFYVTSVYDPKREEWVEPEVVNDDGKIVNGKLLIKLRSFRGDFDYFRNFMVRIWRETEKALDEILVELSAVNPDKWSNHKLAYAEDIDDELAAEARKAYNEDVERWDTKRKADWEERKAKLDAENPERAKQYEKKAAPAADKQPDSKVTQMKPKADEKKAAAPKAEVKTNGNPEDGEEPSIPF